ncbi:patatin-like phospholipase family protein [Desulfobulbus alkaliphilus]|uniref:patatin-like phospholipase family protein n=1 Tax=Desulfobulbus alkaliphilus TaxID=869814 RepID=UPI001962A0BA|nr:patatin-like phospholipase family protein [Desulfobulbus alkaliphilus]MBM9538726.1 patatin-like phospholipase family protein [Desulfobulbus alkaliphilus]
MRFALLLGILIFLQPSAPASAAPKEIGLALGSGGASGLAHIAILRVFDEMDIRPARISGTSIGAVIGALYAAGLSADEIEAIFRDFAGSKLDALTGILRSDLKLYDVLAVNLDDGGLIDPTAFLKFLAGHVEATRFEDLHIPLAVVATDFWSGESVIIDEGDLFAAVHASMAVPGLFDPVIRGDLLLVDGGTSRPLPFDLLFSDTDRVVAIDVSGNRRPSDDNTGITDLLFKTFELMQQSLIREMILRQEPDLYIQLDISDVRLLEFHRLDTILEQARPGAEHLREQLRKWQTE